MKERLRAIIGRIKAGIRLPRLLSRLDRYIMVKFIGTYIYSIALIISISIVFDINENLSLIHI